MSEPQTIGILGGLGPESTTAYYSYITRQYHQQRGDYAYPPIVIYSLSFQPVIDAGYQRAAMVRDAIEKLAAAGCNFVVAACNSIHIVYDEVSRQIPIPWISITDPTADAISAAGLGKVALLGTSITMNAEFFPKDLSRRGIECIVPAADDQERINTIIFTELVTGRVTDASRQFATECIDRLADAGAEGVILGCTELPFLIRPADSALPTFDTTALHAQRALDLALGE